MRKIIYFVVCVLLFSFIFFKSEPAYAQVDTTACQEKITAEPANNSVLFTISVSSQDAGSSAVMTAGVLILYKETNGTRTELDSIGISNQQFPFTLSTTYSGAYSASDQFIFEISGEGKNSSRALAFYCLDRATVSQNTGGGDDLVIAQPASNFEMVITPLKTVVDCTQNNLHCDEENAKESLYSFSEAEMNDPKYFQEDSTKRAIVTVRNVGSLIKDDNDTRGRFYICLKTNGCQSNEYLALNGAKLKDDSNNKLFRNNGNDIAFYICPSGTNDLKVQKDCDRTLSPFKFYGGKIFKVGLYEKYDNNTFNVLTENQFFINYSFPYVFANGALIGDGGWLSQNNIPKFTQVLPFRLPLVSGSKLSIVLAGRKSGDSDASGGNGSNAAGTNNNYQLILTNSTGTYKKTKCSSVLSYNIDSKAVNRSNNNKLEPSLFSYDDQGGGDLPPGRYRLEVKEQVNEGKKCEGGPSLWEFEFEISRNTNTDASKGPTKDKDPYTIELVSQTMDPSSLNLKSQGLYEVKKGTFRCLVEEGTDNCIKLQTAIGEISLKPTEFITQAFQFLLGLAGTIAIFMLVINGYKLLTSAGDKQKIADSREKITGAITGILFIILSFVILEFIANDVLRIPGFN